MKHWLTLSYRGASKRIPVRRDATGLEKLANLNDLFLGKIVLTVRKHGGMAIELYMHAISRPVLHFGAQILEEMNDFPEIDIGADRMGEKGVQDLAVMMIHFMPGVRRF